jgi:hypothetical protein
MLDERRGKVKQKDHWPPPHISVNWLYEPSPMPNNKAPVGQEDLIHIWRNPSHADRDSYAEFLRTASWAARAKDWLQNKPHI